MPYRLAVAIIAKGSMNNLHRPEVVDVFRARGVELRFLVREAYAHLVDPLPGARYLKVRFPEETGRLAYWRTVCRFLRSLYPDGGMGLVVPLDGLGARRRLTYRLLRELARSQALMRLLFRLEARLYRTVRIDGLDPAEVDQLLLQGIGTHGAEHESLLTWWAKQHGVSVVHMIGNYDHLASKGYRGAPVDHLLVWGAVMREDAVRLHGVPPERIRTIGPVRYDTVVRGAFQDRATFLRSIGLDPDRRTILFAGSLAEYHYFEMLQAFEQLRAEDEGYQLILRIYPERTLMASPFMKPLVHYARGVPGVYVSLGDPHAWAQAGHEEPPRIEQAELWHALRHSDVVVNLYSTIALEACLFDKPIVCVLYHPTRGYAWARPPRYFDYGRLLHNRRMVAYGVMTLARDRGELLQRIREAVADPERFKAQRAYAVEQELGTVDGRACERLADACVEAWRQAREGRGAVRRDAAGGGTGG